MIKYTLVLAVLFYFGMVCVSSKTIDKPCKGAVPIPGSYCGMGGQPCPEGSYCDIHPADAYAVCCRPKRGASCPKLDPGQIGTCVESCSSDDDCDANLKCCSNGCGHVCTKPVH